MRTFSAALLFCFAPLPGCSHTPEPLRVFAAVSTTEPLSTLARQFEQQTGAKIELAFGASHELVRQLLAGAHADVLVSADAESLLRLLQAGRVDKGAVRAVAKNSLVVVVPTASHLLLRTAQELTSLHRVAIADPALAPLGSYTQRWLEKESVWDALAPHRIPTANARATAAAAAAAHVDAAVVYATDAKHVSGLRVAFVAPSEKAPLVCYLAAPVGAARHRLARLFAEYLSGSKGREAFTHAGFSSLAPNEEHRCWPKS